MFVEELATLMFFYLVSFFFALSRGELGLNDGVVSIVSPGVFQINVKVAGSESDTETLLLDTGSPYTWLYHYRYVRDVLRYPYGGYGVTRLRTRIEPPRGGVDIKYVDESEIGASVWTVKEFSIGEHSWSQPFGIAERVKQSDPLPLMTGLLGASRGSYFAAVHPVFGFEPVAPGQLALRLSHQDGGAVCRRGEFAFFDIVKEGKYSSHWSTDTVIKFGKVAFKTGMIVDSGSSVLVLNLPMFEKFRQQLALAGVPVEYGRGALSGTVSCHFVDRMPSWEIHEGSQVILVTPRMYVTRRAGGLCRVAVAGIDGNHPMILGTPALRWLVSEFDSKNGRMGLCAPVKSFISDKGMMDPDLYEVQDCPSCNMRSRGIQGKTYLAVFFLLLFSL